MRSAVATPDAEILAMKEFRAAHPELFRKNDWLLAAHLASVLGLLAGFTALALWTPLIPLKILFGIMAALFWFALINITIHHHHTHHNAAASRPMSLLLSGLYYLIPEAAQRKSRYIRIHLNHHARPFDETDVDHLFNMEREMASRTSIWRRIVFYLELTFVGTYMPGWSEDKYINTVPMDQWNMDDYRKVKREEYRQQILIAAFHWSLFVVALVWLPWLAWGWLFPLLMIKNWAHYIGQFQHYDETLLEPERSIWRRTRSFRIPGWFNYLLCGEISGHFVHHMFPQIPYYRVESARRRILENERLASLFVTY